MAELDTLLRQFERLAGLAARRRDAGSDEAAQPA
jgi:hypothetical protein